MLFKEFPAEDNPRKNFRRLTSNADLPGDKILTGYIRQAMKLNEAGIKTSPRQKSKPKKVVVPDYFLAAFKKNKKTLATFGNFSPSCQREYVEWIAEARREKTRAKRIQTAVDWIAKGKSRNWKYQ